MSDSNKVEPTEVVEKQPQVQPEPEKEKGKTASPTKKETDRLQEAMQFMAAGKRHMLVKDISVACESFSQAVQVMNELYSETAAECAEAYFCYGRALLELARMERGVIENMDEADDSADNSTDEDDAEEAEDGDKKESGDDNEDEEEEKEEKEGDAEAKDGEDGDKDQQEENDGNESIGSNDAAGTSSADREAKDRVEMEREEEEDPSNLQLAWEILEMSKVCFQKKSDAVADDKPEERLKMELKLADIYQTLGELSIENETYQQSIDDLSNCLRRRMELLSEDDRSIAETHYQLGVAYGFNLEFDLAVNALNDAIIVLKKRVDNLRSGKVKYEGKDAFYTPEKEADEIESLIPEIEEKIADTKDMQKETLKKLGDRALAEESSEIEVAAGSSSGAGDQDGKSKGGTTKGSSSTNGSSNGHASEADNKSNGNGVNDISHLMKKKRKSDTATATANGSTSNGTPSKKAKLEEGQ